MIRTWEAPSWTWFTWGLSAADVTAPARPERGKWLYFSPQAARLDALAAHALSIREGFDIAKRSRAPREGDYALCIYAADATGGAPRAPDGVAFRGWKRNTTTPSAHYCHAFACEAPCAPEYLMCPRHWRKVPVVLQRAVYAAYRPGQCDDRRISGAWLRAADAAIAHVAVAEGRWSVERAAAFLARAADNAARLDQASGASSWCLRCLSDPLPHPHEIRRD